MEERQARERPAFVHLLLYLVQPPQNADFFAFHTFPEPCHYNLNKASYFYPTPVLPNSSSPLIIVNKKSALDCYSGGTAERELDKGVASLTF